MPDGELLKLLAQPAVVAAVVAAVVSLLATLVTLYTSNHQRTAKDHELTLKRKELEQLFQNKVTELDLKKQELQNALSLKMQELDLKREELSRQAQKLTLEADTIRQTMMRDVLAKRLVAYGVLWNVMITYDLNWKLERKPHDTQWIELFARKLNECNAEHGAYFSEQVYKAFFAFRDCVIRILLGARSTGSVDTAELEKLERIAARGDQSSNTLSLGTAIKNDLGSYMKVAIQQ